MLYKTHVGIDARLMDFKETTESDGFGDWTNETDHIHTLSSCL